MPVSKKILFFLITAVLLQTSFFSYSQESDTIKINITNTQYDTIHIFDTTYFIDTIYTSRLIEGYDISPTFSPFGVKWRTYRGLLGIQSEQKNFTYGLEVAAVKNKLSLSGGFFYSKIENRIKFEQNITDIDTITNINIVQDSYFNIDTIGSEWQLYTYDSITIDTITITIADSILVFNIDTTQVFYNDTILTTSYDTTKFDTSYNYTSNISYFDIPIIFRYRLYSSSKIDIFVGTGFMLGILRRTNMYYFNPSDGSAPKLIGEKNYTQILPSIWLSSKITYYPLSSLGLFIEPYYCLGIKSIFKKDFDVITIPDRYGIRFGLSYLF